MAKIQIAGVRPHDYSVTVWCNLNPMTCFRSICKILILAVREGKEEREITRYLLCSLIMVIDQKNSVFQLIVKVA